MHCLGLGSGLGSGWGSVDVAGGKEKKVFGEEAQDFLEMKIKAAVALTSTTKKNMAKWQHDAGAEV